MQLIQKVTLAFPVGPKQILARLSRLWQADAGRINHPCSTAAWIEYDVTTQTSVRWTRRTGKYV